MIKYIGTKKLHFYLPVAQLDSASDSATLPAWRYWLQSSLPITCRCPLRPKRQTLKVLASESLPTPIFFTLYLPVAQLDSASDSDSEGRRFKSFRVGQNKKHPVRVLFILTATKFDLAQSAEGSHTAVRYLRVKRAYPFG